MVSVGAVIRHLIQHPLPAMLDAVNATTEIKCRHALFGQTEVIGTVKSPSFRFGIGVGNSPLFANRLINIIIQFGIAVSHDGHIMGWSVIGQNVHIQCCHRLVEGDNGIFGIIGRTKKPLFLCRDRHKHDRTARFQRPGHIGIGKFDQPGGTTGIIRRTVINLVALQRGIPAHMIPVGHMNDIFIGKVSSRHNGDHIAGHHTTDFIFKRNGHFCL